MKNLIFVLALFCGNAFATDLKILSAPRSPGASDCRANIARVICLVDPMPGQQPVERPCLAGGENYVHHFESLYDNYPPALQKMFCSLRHIYIEREFEGTAYGGVRKDPDGNISGAVMGIRQSVLDSQLDLSAWASWKEQLSFGGIKDSYTLSPNLPRIETRSTGAVNDFLYFVVAHEFGHIFDFANGLNKTLNCRKDAPECELTEDSWGQFSWLSSQTLRVANQFFKWNALCFYWCGNNPVAAADVPRVYETFAATDLISLYAASQPWDDFADSLAYFLVAQNLNTSYVIQTGQGESYDIMAKLRSPLFRMKYDYLERFLKRTDLVYP